MSIPPAGARIDRSHPQAGELYTLCCFSENAGLPFEAVTGTQAVQRNGTTAATWDSAGWKPQSGTWFSLNKRPTTVAPFTMFFLGTVPSIDTNDKGRIITTGDAWAGAAMALNNFGGTNNLRILYVGVAWIAPSPAIVPPTNTLVFLAVTGNTSTQKYGFYLRRYDTGAVTYRTASSASSPTNTGTNMALNGGGGNDTSATYYHQLVGYAQRDWSREELDSFSSNPWALFRSPDAWLYAAAGGSPVSVSMAGILITGTLGASSETVSSGQAGIQISDSVGATSETVATGQAAIQIADATGNESETVTISLAGLLITDALGGFSVSAGGSVSVSVAGIQISDSLGNETETVTISLAGTSISAAMGVITTSGGGGGPLVITTPYRTVLISAPANDGAVDAARTVLIAAPSNPGAIDPTRTKVI